VPTESFFNFFSPPAPPSDEDDEEAEIGSDIEDRLELDYQLGEDIKEKLIPRAIDWFTGEALAFEELDEDDLEEDFDDDEDDEDDLSEDHDEEEETDEEVCFSHRDRQYPARSFLRTDPHAPPLGRIWQA
jgi:nucleosome assembly protein 1-like 1